MKQDDLETLLSLRNHLHASGKDVSIIDRNLEQLANERIDGLRSESKGSSEGASGGRMMFSAIFALSLGFAVVTAAMALALASPFYARFAMVCTTICVISAIGYVHLKVDAGLAGVMKSFLSGK